MNSTRGFYFNDVVVAAQRFYFALETHNFLKARAHDPITRFLAAERADLEILLALYKAGQK